MSDGNATETTPPAPAPVPAPPKDTAPAMGTVPDTGKKDGDEPLGPNGVKALQAERKRADEFEKRLNALKPLEQIAAALGGGDAAKGKSEIEKLAEQHAKLEETIAEERQARWRAELAHDHGLTPAQAKRLIGTTREELAADAAELVKDFAVDPSKPKTPKPDRSQGGGSAGTGATGSVESGRDLYRTKHKPKQGATS